MKAILTSSFTAALLIAGAASAQAEKSECTAEQKAKSSDCCESQVAKENGSKPDFAKRFGALKPEARKEVIVAMTFLGKNCPIGRRLPGTFAALDKLYSGSTVKLAEMRKGSSCEETNAKLDKEIALIGKLRKINGASLAAFQALSSAAKPAAPAADDCGGDMDCGEACIGMTKEVGCDMKGENGGGCDMTKADPIAMAMTSWKTAGAELEKLDKNVRAELASSMKVLAKYEVSLPTFAMKALKEQFAILSKSKGESCCASEILTKAHGLLAATPMFGKPTKKAEAGECTLEQEKSDCHEETKPAPKIGTKIND